MIEQTNNVQGGDNVREALIKAIKEVHLGSSVAPKKGTPKKTKWYDVVTEDNVITGKRKAKHIGMVPPSKKTSHSVESIVDNAVSGSSYTEKLRLTLTLGMKVKIQYRRFDGKATVHTHTTNQSGWQEPSSRSTNEEWKSSGT